MRRALPFRGAAWLYAANNREASLIRFAATCLVLSFATAAAAQSPGLDAAARNYPPFVLGANVRATDGSPPYARACPPASATSTAGGATTPSRCWKPPIG